MSDPANDSTSETHPHTLLERGFHEAVRRSATCPHNCRSFLVTLILDIQNPLKAGLRDCAFGWFRQEYPANKSNLLFKAPLLSHETFEVPSCPFCGSTSLLSNGFEDNDGVTFVISCQRCDSDGPIIKDHQNRAIQAWNLRTSTPRAWLGASFRGTYYEHPLPSDDSATLRECPFCGQRRLHVTSLESGPPFLVSCDNCEAAGPNAEDREGAMRQWNYRV